MKSESGVVAAGTTAQAMKASRRSESTSIGCMCVDHPCMLACLEALDTSYGRYVLSLVPGGFMLSVWC